MEKQNLFTVLLMVIFGVTIVVLILLMATKVVTSPPSDSQLIDQLLRDISLQTGFGDPVSVDGERGGCLLYETFSLDTSVVDNLSPVGDTLSYPAEFQCDDGFLKALSKVYRTCKQDECLGTDGETYYRGQSQVYYSVCKDLPLCKNGRSVVVLDYQTINGKIDKTLARCLAVNSQNQFYLTDCTSTVDINNNTFLSIDTQAVTSGSLYSQVRIRIPNKDLCLVYNDVNQLVTAPCLERKDKGFTWIFTPELTSTNNTVYPSQILQFPVDLTVEDIEKYTSIDQVISDLEVYNSVQQNPTFTEIPILLGYTDCAPSTISNCPARTSIVSAYSWNNQWS